MMDSLKFVPFSSSINPGFWSELAKVKLDVSGLNEEPLDIWGTFTNSDDPAGGLAPRLSLEWDAFRDEVKTNWNCLGVRGKVVVKNTVEAFKSENKSEFLSREGKLTWSKIAEQSWIDDPEVLTTFNVLMFADLKKYLFYYWFAFPAFSLSPSVSLKSCEAASSVFTPDQLTKIGDCVKSQVEHRVYSLLVITSEGSVTRLPLSHLCSAPDLAQCFVTVCDPASGPYPGWPVRNIITALHASYPDLVPGLRLLCLRNTVRHGQLSVGGSLVLTLTTDTQALTTEMPGVVGWEKNDKGQLGPRLANMRASMDPVKIAENSVDLNLKLMKWRLVPELQLDKIQAARCLLLGAGTLGCAVSRSLLGWGVRAITLVDSGKVSYSNPVRQSLFTFTDCLEGGRPKAVAAAGHLKEVFPGVRAEGVELSIPMPGHTATGALLDQARASYDRLVSLIDEHDVIFLLMDSRESRWLPTALAALKPEKLVVNAALGFDSYLVMRHGVRGQELGPGEPLLGCYFCNDVVAPGDSTTDRTLDQQCTVTRPGASGVAASLAVELAVSVLTHPRGTAAPATASESVLGAVPHTIRGSLSGFTQFTPVGPAFSQCTGCCDKVLDTLRTEGWEMVRRVMESPKYLEDLTGLTDLMNDEDLMAGVIDLADDDTFSVSSGDI